MFGWKKSEPAAGSTVAATVTEIAVTPEAIPLDSFPIKELLSLKSRLDGIIAARRAEVQAQFAGQLELYGLSIDDVRPARKKRAARVKYRDPDNPAHTWSGIGRPKKWLQHYLDQGRQLADFAAA